jgi:CHAT domain-containing protein
VIETEGWLAQVPFEALLDSQGRYLVERTSVVRSLGLSADATPREDTPITSNLRALIVGSAASSQFEGLVPLPGVAAEAEGVARNFHSSLVLQGPDATVTNIERELPGAAVFHFTGHSLARVNGAALLLRIDNGQKGTSSVLGAERFRRFDLHGLQLGVLSACNTASRNDASRGFGSIAEALQRAGVPHVVASQWAVDAVATRAFVGDFYRSALSGQPVSQAVRQAAQNMMADPRTAHPYYWSAFSAYGRP